MSKKINDDVNEKLKSIGINPVDYNHLSYSEMAELPEMEKIKKYLIYAEKKWFEGVII